MTYTMQPFPTLTDSDVTDLMNAINQIARIRLQDIANQTNVNANTQNIATTGCIACTATGTNAIALQQNANQIVISGYTNYQQFSFVAAHTSSGNVTVNINGIGALNLYQSDGATQAATGAITAAALYIISYNSALNSAAGGFQLLSGGASPLATSSSAGIVQPDNGSITIFSGILTANYGLVTALGVGSFILGTANQGEPAGTNFAGNNVKTQSIGSVAGTFNAAGTDTNADSLTGSWKLLQTVANANQIAIFQRYA